ncbi:pollen receptor-like kinase 1 [Apium graveolens]|uniref:pollen receptor-like kinase 1 n=1 Tax=Apium graveolens TaxID=4045 RepID=UPI003D7A6791
MALTAKIHDNVYRIARPPRLLIALAILPNLWLTSLSDISSESAILLNFKDSLSNNTALFSWNDTKPPCPTGNWAGVHCVDNSVRALRLQRIGLKGNLKVEMLKDLRGLRTISIMGNELEGEIPDFTVLSALKYLYMSDNKFSGGIKIDAFHGMISLKKLHAASNQFSGPIPGSLALLPKLKELKLENNRFSGEIPNFQQQNLTSFNVSNNQLSGRIPDKLIKLDRSSFAGNKKLCGGAMGICMPKVSDVTVVGVMVALVAAVAIAAALVILHRRRRQASQQREIVLTMPPEQAKLMASGGAANLDKLEYGGSSHVGRSGHRRKGSSLSSRKKSNVHSSTRLIFLRDDRPSFDLTDLLSASAEILGSGVFGSTYKAAMNNGSSSVMVVKKYAKMNDVTRDEFHEHVRMLGKLKHPNVLPIVAYYYRKEEKLLVSDYCANVSLAVHLHGGGNKLDWGKRFRIVKGVARGLLYLYTELPSLIAPHGHLKSANVVLNEAWEPLLNDYALSRLVNQEDAQELMIMYKSPEYRAQGRVSKKADVWSLGILILEILSGRFPANIIQQGKGVIDGDLAAWVEIQVKENENWKDKVFDKNIMMNIKAGGEEEQEMHKLLKIGLACSEMDVEKRLDIREAVERIENVRETDRIPPLVSSSSS